MKNTKWQIEYLWIDEDGICKTRRFDQIYTNFDAAIKDYEDYVRLQGYGWYRLIEITEKVMTY